MIDANQNKTLSTGRQIRNFAIIAHIDHGKSTLADRLLEFTGTVQKREMKAQLLDNMDIERERGISIKLAPVRMEYGGCILNLIDTPGHVDFSYEVSRSLAASEGALLLVDATQGIQAQTLANLYLALEQGLEIIPVINKIDLPSADVEKISQEIISLLGCTKEDIVLTSAKEGLGIKEALDAVIKRVPPPKGDLSAPLRALIFDSVYDEYRGIIVYLRLVDGEMQKEDYVKLIFNNKETSVLDVGFFKPQLVSSDKLRAGEIGYAVLNLKEVSECRVGDTITSQKSIKSQVHKVNSQKTDKEDLIKTIEPLPGYKKVAPMVFAGVFPQEGNAFESLREAILKIKLSDSAISFEPENSRALGFGFRCGFLGLLHIEIFQERMEREFNLKIIITAPSVAYKAILTNNEEITIHGPQDLPESTRISVVSEPIMKVDIVTPQNYIGGIMSLVAEKRGEYLDTEYLDEQRAILHYNVPLASLIVDFYDRLKSVSQGYASLNYEFFKYKKTDVIRLDVLVAEDYIEALASIVYKDDAYRIGRKIVENLKKELPRQMFEIKIQAAIGGKIIASERLSAMRKDVTAKLYGGDRTRRKKLLEKQKKGKKKMKSLGKGSVEIPPKAFMAVLKR